MNVLHITRDFPPRHCGGISTAVGGLARAQQRAGLNVGVVSFDAWRPRAASGGSAQPHIEAAEGITVVRVSAPGEVDAARMLTLAQQPALLHVHDGMLWEFADRLRSAGGIAALMTVHVAQRHMNELRGTREQTLSLVGQERALAEADRVIAPSCAAADALLASHPALAARLRIIGHGIEDTPAAQAAASRSRDRRVLLSVGRFADAKGTPELFDAMRRVLSATSDTEIVVAGGVPANRRAEARWLRRWHGETPAALRARARFAGWLDTPALAALYGEARALMLASRYETFGLVALEAMLHGLPVASTAAGGIGELIADRDTGLLSAPGDAAALAEHAIALLTDDALAARLGQSGAQAVRQKRLSAHVLPAMLAVYAELA